MVDIAVPKQDFSGVGTLFGSFAGAQRLRQQNDMQANLEGVLANLPKGPDGTPDFSAASAAALRAGDIHAATALANLGQAQQQAKFQRDQARQAQSNNDRSYALQVRSADEAARGIDYKEVDDGTGTGAKKLVKIDKRNDKVTDVSPGGANPGNPYAYPGKMNENQSKDAGYANRMFESEQILRDPKAQTAAMSPVERTIDKLPFLGSSGKTGLGNHFQSSDYQRYDQAARDFINATLRRESGAAISESEFENAYKQYLPRPGDSADVLLQKNRNRQATIGSIAGGGGHGYRPPYTFDEKGEMIVTGAGRQGERPSQTAQARPRTREEIQASIANARARIARDPAARDNVLKTLRANGINISGL